MTKFHRAYERRRFNPEPEQQGASGGGRKATLRTMAAKLFSSLLYCKCHPTVALLSVLFDFDRSCAPAWVHRLLPILATALG